jgi:hypothetical protein
MIADFDSLDKPPALFSFRSMSRDHPLTVEHFQFSSRQSGAACQGSYDAFFEAALEKMGTKTQIKTVCYYLSSCFCVLVANIFCYKRRKNNYQSGQTGEK